jgi:hypothetical protein
MDLFEQRHESQKFASLVLLVKRPPNEPPPDLGGTASNFKEFCIPQKPSRRVVVNVAVSAQNLNCVQADLGALLGDKQGDAGAVLGRGVPPVCGTGYGVDVRSAGGRRGVHVGHLSLQQLELSNLLSKLLPLVGVLEGDVAGRLHDAERRRGEHKALDVEARHEDVDALVQVTQDVGLGDLAVFKDELARWRTPEVKNYGFYSSTLSRGVSMAKVVGARVGIHHYLSGAFIC